MLNLESKYVDTGRERPLIGEISKKALRDTSFLEVLGLELIVRSRPALRVKAGRDAFVLLARSQNDAASKDALEAAYRYTVLTEDQSPASLNCSVEKFRARERMEQQKFFQWLESVYWSLPLYAGDYWEERTNGNWGFQLSDPLPKLKKKVMNLVAGRIWNGKNDELGLRAFDFLVACTVSSRFRAKAVETTKAVEEYIKRHFSSEIRFREFELPKDDIKTALDAIRSSIPNKVDELREWLTRKDLMTPEVWRIFAHAYINAGGDVLKD